MEIHEQQIRQRISKLSNIERDYNHLIEWDLEKSELYKADACIVSWGFSVVPVREAIVNLRKKEIKIAALFPKLLFPVCVNALHKLLSYNSSIIVVESNFSGQFASLIRMYTDTNVISVKSFNGQPISSDYIEL
jgi:2-oxoglutarate ferredoxin oxidoreductase subunit alpha